MSTSANFSISSSEDLREHLNRGKTSQSDTLELADDTPSYMLVFERLSTQSILKTSKRRRSYQLTIFFDNE